MLYSISFSRLAFALAGFILIYSPWVQAEPVHITLLHTNDLHSHFRKDGGPMQLGGLSRIYSAVQRLRSQNPHTFLLDGGDWSEGSIYYNEGGGVESIKMMDRLGYDVAVVGNHDWLNGPDILLNSLQKAQPKTKFVSANLSPQDYSRADEFRYRVPPYVIREVNGVKIAFIGLSTFEKVYDKFISPISIEDPKDTARDLSEQLKENHEVDAVVVISHNSTNENKKILKAAPEVDLIIGAHDHLKYTAPVIVERSNAKPGWIVETGAWGEYLGRVDMTVDSGEVNLDHYELMQMNSTIPEDPGIIAEIEALENRLEKRYGPIFHDHVGESHLEFSRKGLENDLGNLTVDAYMHSVVADFAIDSSRFINGAIHEGPLSSADVYNAHPTLYNPETGKNWTLKFLDLTGRKIKWVLYGMYTTKKLSAYGALSASGITFTYDPLFLMSKVQMGQSLSIFDPLLEAFGLPVVKNIQIQGEPLDENRTYRVALGQGVVEAIEFFDSTIMNFISLKDVMDTGLEQWRILKDYIQYRSPITREQLPLGNRIRTLQPDLAVLYDDVQMIASRTEGESYLAQIRVRVKNIGSTESEPGSSDQGPTLRLLYNQNKTDYTKEPLYSPMGEEFPIPSLEPGESKDFVWNVKLDRHQGLYPITARIEGIESQVDHTYDEVTRYFK